MLRIEFERRRRKLSQTDVARLAHVRQQDVSLIEQGRYIPLANQLERLARVFCVSASTLLQPVEIVTEQPAQEQV
jgi:transcriptional regulator with XRE-family HTH domain